jgi:hypothetical protein
MAGDGYSNKDRISAFLSQRKGNGEEAAGKRPKVLRLLIEFDGQMFDFFTFHRSLTTETYNAEQPDGLDYNIVLHFKSYPFTHIFAYATPEYRERKLEELKKKLSEAKIKVI